MTVCVYMLHVFGCPWRSKEGARSLELKLEVIVKLLSVGAGPLEEQQIPVTTKLSL